jgi:C4-type Zn-finger protein
VRYQAAEVFISDNTPEMDIIQNGNNMNCPTNHANIELHTKYSHNPYETEQRGECQDCGASLDVTDIPDDAEVRDEYGRLVDHFVGSNKKIKI